MSLWQPIETAPKRGYIFGAYQYGVDRWAAHCMWWDDSVEEWTDVYSDRYIKPTHWAPLPESKM